MNENGSINIDKKWKMCPLFTFTAFKYNQDENCSRPNINFSLNFILYLATQTQKSPEDTNDLSDPGKCHMNLPLCEFWCVNLHSASNQFCFSLPLTWPLDLKCDNLFSLHFLQNLTLNSVKQKWNTVFHSKYCALSSLYSR